MTALQLSWLDLPELSPVRLVPAPSARRDDVLEVLAERRAVLVEQATAIALELAHRDGSTCAPRVLSEMRRRGIDLETCDRRWMGAVLLPSRGWERTGEHVNEGSKARPVPLWKRTT